MPIQKKGSAALMFWGTDGILTGALQNCHVESVDPSPVVIKEEVEDNNGFTDGSFHGDNGVDVTIGIIYKSGITYPAVGDSILVKLPGDSVGKTYVVEEPVLAGASRKKAAVCKFKASYRPNRT